MLMVDRAQRLLEDSGFAHRDLRAFEVGSQHHLFRLVGAEDGKPYVLKIARVGDPFGDAWDPARKHLSGLRAEAAAVAMARRVEVPRPSRILSESPPSALMPHLPGESGQSLWDRRRLDEQGLRDLCYAMGGALASVHSLKRPEDPGDIPDLPIPDFDPGMARLLHMDFHLGNVQVVRDRVRGMYQVKGIVDWVLCRWGPREADLVELSISVFRQFPEARGAFMAGYRRAGGLVFDAAIERRFTLIELRRRLPLAPTDKVRKAWEKWIGELTR
jgi:aminoglycoside phosphotransferase (APT) family kinase protein